MGNNPSYCSGNNFPVENVSWYDVQKFISRLNAATGKNYRLPTEAEWEYAARGGNRSQGYKYSGSDNIEEVAWFFAYKYAQRVGTKKANELGIHDMSGNVWEWCQDWYDSYSDSSQQNPTGASKGTERVNRGGCYSSYADDCRVAPRRSCSPDRSDPNLGFRLVLVP
jgi:formylglycine-generating enzyme required for sulfatase activity